MAVVTASSRRDARARTCRAVARRRGRAVLLLRYRVNAGWLVLGGAGARGSLRSLASRRTVMALRGQDDRGDRRLGRDRPRALPGARAAAAAAGAGRARRGEAGGGRRGVPRAGRAGAGGADRRGRRGAVPGARRARGRALRRARRARQQRGPQHVGALRRAHRPVDLRAHHARQLPGLRLADARGAAAPEAQRAGRSW